MVGEPYVNIKLIADLKHLTKNKRKESSEAGKFKVTASVKRVLKKLKLKQLEESFNIPVPANYIVSVD